MAIGRKPVSHKQKPKAFGPILTANGISGKSGSVAIRALAKIALDSKETDKLQSPKSCEELQQEFEALFRISLEDERHGTQIGPRAVRFSILSEILGGLVIPRVIFRNGYYSTGGLNQRKGLINVFFAF